MSELKVLQTRLDGRYDIEQCLGRGSYAEIYVARDQAATDESLQEVVIKALNVLLQGVPDTELERTLIENFQNEAVALDRVRHPHVINRLGHGTAIDLSGKPFHYIVLEYLSGGDLAVLCRAGRLPVEQALLYLEQVCAGLAYAHTHGVIHRDIKPQNLLLTADCQVVKIADFGVAKTDLGNEDITRVGTNIYAAPEHNPLVQTGQLDTASLPIMRGRLTPAADIYSLAKTTYAVLTGEAPRRFAQHSITELPESVSHEYWATPVLRVLRRATQTRPLERYQTVDEFWQELRDAGMPPTRPLDPAEAASRGRVSADLDTVVVPQAPPRPTFEMTTNLPAAFPGNGVRPARIVVPVTGSKEAQQMLLPVQRPKAGEISAAMPDANVVKRRPVSPPVAKPRSRVAGIVVAVLLVAAFAGMLFATQLYIRSRWTQAEAPRATSIVGQEAATTTDLNLRAEPSSANERIGLAEQGSRVRILSTNGNWCEVEVIQHGRPKDDPSSSDRGWVSRRYLKFD
ncbi:MAG: serine/threonine protein kinase [Pyrinomonadaceae bacterium]